MSDSEEEGIENHHRETLMELKKRSKSRFARLALTIMSHIDGKGDCTSLKVHRSNFVELHGECQRPRRNWMTKAQPTVEGLDKATKWLTTLDLRFNFCIQSIDEYLNEHEFENTLYVEVDQTDNDDEDNAIEAMKLHYTLQQILLPIHMSNYTSNLH